MWPCDRCGADTAAPVLLLGVRAAQLCGVCLEDFSNDFAENVDLRESKQDFLVATTRLTALQQRLSGALDDSMVPGMLVAVESATMDYLAAAERLSRSIVGWMVETRENPDKMAAVHAKVAESNERRWEATKKTNDVWSRIHLVPREEKTDESPDPTE